MWAAFTAPSPQLSYRARGGRLTYRLARGLVGRRLPFKARGTGAPCERQGRTATCVPRAPTVAATGRRARTPALPLTASWPRGSERKRGRARTPACGGDRRRPGHAGGSPTLALARCTSPACLKRQTSTDETSSESIGQPSSACPVRKLRTWRRKSCPQRPRYHKIGLAAAQCCWSVMSAS